MATKLFTSVRIPKVKRNKFDMTHQVKLTTEFGRLTPCFIAETIPGDTWKMSTDLLCRMMPLATPVMQNFEIYTHFFFVPQRLIWSEWQDFITGGKTGKAKPPIPKLHFDYSDIDAYDELLMPSSLANYLGLPPLNKNKAGSSAIDIDVRPFRAYQLIYNEYYRDENQQDEIDIHADWSGLHNMSADNYGSQMMSLRQRCWRKDYFTSALPWPEQGGEGMPIPIDIKSGNIIYDANSKAAVRGSNPALLQELMRDVEGESRLFTEAGDVYDGLIADLKIEDGRLVNPNGERLILESQGSTYVNISDIAKHLKVSVSLGENQTTINDFRRALAAQKWLEAAARGGHRYIEAILSHFGVRSSDARLQRPEYLGGGKTNINIGDILQTSQTTEGDDGSPLGQYAGIGAGAAHLKEFTKYIEEHGYIIGIVSVMPRADYFQGIPRMWLREDRYDYYWPEFAHIGEQPIYNAELYSDLKNGVDKGTFGYTPRYAEYKYIPNRIAGAFADVNDELMMRWHDARVFDKLPALNNEFLEVRSSGTTGLNRIYTYGASDVDHILLQMQHNTMALRKMPVFGTPLI